MFKILILSLALVATMSSARAFADAPVKNDKQCPVLGQKAKDAAGNECVCSQDPDGDDEIVWVCEGQK